MYKPVIKGQERPLVFRAATEKALTLRSRSTRTRAAAVTTFEGLDNKLDDDCVNTIRFLSIDGVNKANSGHPGAPMGLAPMAYLLWTEVMKYNPKNP